MDGTVHADVAIIGGTGLYDLDGHLEYVTQLDVPTPWGAPSSPVTISRTAAGKNVAFINRHGVSHQFSPSGVPYRANIAALKHLGVKTIIAFSAVGSLRQQIGPRDFIIPNQLIDRTKGIRESSFYGNGLVGHAAFGEPFDVDLHRLLVATSKDALRANGQLVHSPRSLDRDVTLIVMEGPAFSTRAESHMYRNMGGDVINMSCLPEAKLAREAEISYQMVCMSTDYDSWRIGDAAVTVDAIMENVKHNTASAKLFLAAVLDGVVAQTESGAIGTSLRGSMRHSVTAPEARDPQLVQDLQFIHPGYYL